MSLDSGLGLFPDSLGSSNSLGSLLDSSDAAQMLRPTDQEVDSLLNALEHATNHDCFIQKNGSFANLLIDSELELEPVPILEVHFDEKGMMEHSLSGLPGEPINFDDLPSDPDLIFDLDDRFKHNSAKLDQFMNRSVNIEKEGGKDDGEEDNESVDYGYGDAAPSIRDNYDVEDQPVEAYPGKRRKSQRRGSMPTMHIGEYSSGFENGEDASDEDPFEPTPIQEGFNQQRTIQVDLDSFLHQHQLEEKLRQDDDEDEDTYSVQPEKRRRAQRRGSMPTMHVRCSMNGVDSQSNTYGDHNSSEPTPVTASGIPGIKFGGRMPRRGSTGSFVGSSAIGAFGQSPMTGNPFIVTLRVDSGIAAQGQDPANVSDSSAMLLRLQNMMQASQATQKALQTWDKRIGLPKSHSQTMVNSSRSRKQLQSGEILAKWDGTPLINKETELGKPRPRAHLKPGRQSSGQHNKMKRRMSAPSISGFVS